MELKDLTRYAESQYHIKEEHKWASFPGFSVLCSPNTGKWVALLMRQWDGQTGEEIQRCDIKCGREILSQNTSSYLSLPFRMKGENWVGVKMEGDTDEDLVRKLLDQAIQKEEQRGFTVVLEGDVSDKKEYYGATHIPRRRPRRNPSSYHRKRQQVKRESDSRGRQLSISDYYQTADNSYRIDSSYMGGNNYESTSLPEIPEKIRQMHKLYQYDRGSFLTKCHNFYVQGKFMENYEDNVIYEGNFHRHFPTYHDLTLQQLRGYFTWRSLVRKGEYRPIVTALAYIYLYELLCGIGVTSPQDALDKMKDFKKGFLEAGYGDTMMDGNLNRWMVEYAIVNNLPIKSIGDHFPYFYLREDEALFVLKNGNKYPDEDIFMALDTFVNDRLKKSAPMKKYSDEVEHLFAGVWRYIMQVYQDKEESFFTLCFGEPYQLPWHPFANAVYWEEGPSFDRTYQLDACRRFICKDGSWIQEGYESIQYQKKLFESFLREADRQFRKYLKTGNYLKEREEGAWVKPIIEGFLEEEERKKREALRPKINIDFSHLNQIRQDAAKTRDSLLTEEEREEFVPTMSSDSLSNVEEREQSPIEILSLGDNAVISTSAEKETQEMPDLENGLDLDPALIKILSKLLQGESADQILQKAHLMPSIVADTINETFFDEIGDNVVECEDDHLTLVEDYQEDVEDILGGNV